jgi:hypothetical protein
VGGICEPNNLCAFPDPLCMSGARYGDYSGALSGVCVGDELAPDAPEAIDAERPDARTDANPDDPCLDWTFMPAEFDPCAIPPPAGAAIELSTSGWTINGATGVVSDGVTSFTVPHVTIGSVDVVSIDHLVIQDGAALRASGPRPLVVAAWMYILIDSLGTLDVNSDGTGRGPGSPSGACMPPGIGTHKDSGSGGSGGAGYGDKGGDGGTGSDGQADGGNGAPSGAIPSVVAAGTGRTARPAARAAAGSR